MFMKKILVWLLFSIAFSLVLSLCTQVFIPVTVLSTLYTVAGVIFSVGMSLTISPKTDRVSNYAMKKNIRRSYLRIRNLFMIFFVLDTFLFIMAEGKFVSCASTFFNLLCAIFLLVSIVYYIINFVSLQKLGEQIEDQVLKEMKEH